MGNLQLRIWTLGLEEGNFDIKGKVTSIWELRKNPLKNCFHYWDIKNI